MSDQLRQRALAWLASEQAPIIATFGMLLLLAYTVVQLTFAFWPPASQSIEDPMVTRAGKQILPEITHLHLFGEYTVEHVGFLPITQLNLTVEGIFYSNDVKQSELLVSTPNVKTKVYRVGDSLPGDAIIRKIFPDSVVIEYGGDLQTLPLIKPALTFAPSPKGFDVLLEKK